MNKQTLTRQNVREFTGRKIRCRYPFLPEENSIDADGNLVLSEDLLLDIEDGTFYADDFYLID